MERDHKGWDGTDAGGEGRAGERLSERSTRLVEKLKKKLARHNRGAEQLAEALHNRRKP
jgi:hypothetical protein